ncbi:MAG: hypothetical protein JO030_08225, partial [Candidatus Eremiobacteraeota bacterium]|nr:hypothetical protein [Candidatus Eremiobacteraeota bacterium]
MLEQYFGMKAKHPEALLLSRVGDFYEAYGEDAEIVARALQIALTSKEAGGGKRVAMAGVPHHALGGYLARLVHQRFIVALAEQLEVPQPNRLVRRDVVRLVTPGTLVEDQLLEGTQNNYLAVVTLAGESFALAYADVSTGYSAASAMSGDGAYDELLAELARLEPTEIVADLPADLRATIATAVDLTGARLVSAALRLVNDRERPPFPGFSLDESLAIHRAVEALRDFVNRTGVSNGEGAVAVLAPQLYRRQQYLAVDAATRKHLELTTAQGRNSRATLLATLDRCVTAMGSRLLARWILAPLVDAAQIAHRADAVEDLVSQHGRRDAMRQILNGTFDVERISQKVRFRRTAPRDLASLRRTLELLPALRQLSVPPLAPFFDRIGGFDGLLQDLQQTLVEDPPAQVGDGGVIRPQAHAELAECIALRGDARARLAQLEERERERTGIKALKIKYASPFGYAIEVAKSHASAVPDDYVRKQTLVNG